MKEGKFKRYLRYLKYIFQWLFLEKARGLDFTMRDIHLLNDSGGVLHGYSKTDESHARLIFSSLCVDENKRLLDIGCGKGAFLREACKEPFGRIAGIEYVPELAEIARQNFNRLGLCNRVKVYVGDAIKFRHYSDYNVFYFFNPFDEEIMYKVIERIVVECKEKIWVILHNPVCASIIEEYGGKEIKRLYDGVKSYETIIYELET